MMVRSVDSARDWSRSLLKDEASTLGRAVRWKDERVLIYTLHQQPTLGIRVELASPTLTLRKGILTWPVREIRPAADQMAATALSRPCLVAIVNRGHWKEIRIDSR